jgi:hypothetical protein
LFIALMIATIAAELLHKAPSRPPLKMPPLFPSASLTICSRTSVSISCGAKRDSDAITSSAK